MAKQWNPKRRRFMEMTAAAAAAGGISACSSGKGPWRYLTAAEAETVSAIAECFIPADEFPGAAWAGATRFIDLQLYGHLRELRPMYRRSLALLGAFASAPAATQVATLKAMEKGELQSPGWSAAGQRQFFRTILAHIMQSYYGDPRHGGNRDQVGYRSIGLSSTPTRGRSQHDVRIVKS